MKLHAWPAAAVRYVLRLQTQAAVARKNTFRSSGSQRSVALWPWSYSYSNRAEYISINCRRAVRTMSAHMWQGANQRTHDLWPASCGLLLMRANLQFLNICDVCRLQLPLQRKSAADISAYSFPWVWKTHL